MGSSASPIALPPGFQVETASPALPPGFQVDTAHTDTAPKSFGDQLLSAASNFWDQVNPVKLAQGVTDTALNLKGAVKGYSDQQNTLFQKAVDSYKAGDYSSAIQHGLHYLINGVPGVGAVLDSASDQAKSGDIGGALGKTAGLATVLIGTPKIPEAAGKLSDATQSARDMVSQVLDHPKVQGAMKDAAVEFAKEVPGVKTVIKTGKIVSAAKEVLDDIRGAQATADLPTVQETPAILEDIAKGPLFKAKSFSDLSEADQSLARGISEKMSAGETPAATKPVPASIAPVEWRTPEEITAASKPAPVAEAPKPEPAAVESTKPPSAWLPPEELDNAKTTGLPVERHMANRTAMAQRFVDKIGGTQNLPTNQSEWARLADELGERVPSKETQAQIEFGLNRRMVTKTETPGVRAETPAYLNTPAKLKAAQAMQKAMEESGTVPSLPVGVKTGAAADLEGAKLGPTVPGVGATVTLKNGKTVIVKELHPDGTFDFHE